MNIEAIEKLIAEDMLYQHHMRIIYDTSDIPAKYEINLMGIAGRLMGIKTGKLPDPWVDTYMEFIKKGKGLNKTERIKLAKECYQRLIELCI